VKKVFDIAQVVLSDGGAVGFLAWCIVIVAVLQGGKILGAAIGLTVQLFGKAKQLLFFPNSLPRIILILSAAGILFMFRDEIVKQSQYIEQAFISPTYIVSDTSYWATSCYETELKRHVNQAEFEIVRDSTYALAKDLGCEPLAIYEVAFSECGMNPFCVRTDGIAAGWIQFTSIGVAGHGVSLSQVKAWCLNRETRSIMALTGKYMRCAASGRNLRTSTDVYCAVFAPGKIGYSENSPLYSGWKNPEYFLNKGLDGYAIRGEKVLFLEYTRDGVLTKNDLAGALAYKKSRLLKKYL
jgi:hypothetical protein